MYCKSIAFTVTFQVVSVAVFKPIFCICSEQVKRQYRYPHGLQCGKLFLSVAVMAYTMQGEPLERRRGGGMVLGYFPLLFRLWLFQIDFPTATRKRWKRPFTAAVVLMLYLRLYAAVADKEILLLFTLLYLKKFLCYTINREDILIYLLLGIF